MNAKDTYLKRAKRAASQLSIDRLIELQRELAGGK